jgi:hypothetical protein
MFTFEEAKYGVWDREMGSVQWNVECGIWNYELRIMSL